MKAEKWLILGALAGIAAVQINKQLRLARERLAHEQPEATGRSSIDDVPTLQPQSPSQPAAGMPRSADDTRRLDESVAPAAPF